MNTKLVVIKQFPHVALFIVVTCLMFHSSLLAQNGSMKIRDFETECILQQSVDFNPFYPWDENESKHKFAVFTPLATLRSEPATQSEVVSRIPIGEFVTGISLTDKVSEIEGLKAPWFKVSWGSSTGFIWSGALTKSFITLKDSSIVTVGVASFSETKYLGQLRRSKGGVIIEKHNLDLTSTDGENTFVLQLWCPPSLDGVKNILVFENEARACGVTGLSFYFAVMKDQLKFISSGDSFGEAGLFHNQSMVLLPYTDFEKTYEYYQMKPEENAVRKLEYHDEYNEEKCQWEINSSYQDLDWLNNMRLKCD